MPGGETCPRIKTSAKQISFWVRKPKFIDKCRIFFRLFNGVLQLILKQSVLAPFLAISHRGFVVYKKGRPQDLTSNFQGPSTLMSPDKRAGSGLFSFGIQPNFCKVLVTSVICQRTQNVCNRFPDLSRKDRSGSASRVFLMEPIFQTQSIVELRFSSVKIKQLRRFGRFYLLRVSL